MSSAARERIRLRLEAWVYPEMADQRQLLAAAADALAHAGGLPALGRTVARTVQRGCGSATKLLGSASPAAAPRVSRKGMYRC